MFLVLATALAIAAAAMPPPPPLEIGFDPLTTSDGAWLDTVAVEPVVASNGFSIVSVFMVGKYAGDGAAAMAFSTSSGGAVFAQSLLPGITRTQNARNHYDRVTSPSIAWNQRYDEFVAATLPISNANDGDNDGDTTFPPLVSRSYDGLHWSAPVAVATGGTRPEKSWIACDNSIFSPHYGACYVAWDDNEAGPAFDLFHVNVSTDGGVTWGPTTTPPDSHSAYGVIPAILPNGDVVVTSEDSSGYEFTAKNIISSVSTDGGQTWSAAYEISPFTAHLVGPPAPHNVRTQSLPSTGVAANGTLYTVWQDCRFRANCAENDLVLSSSQDGESWSTPTRVDVDAVTSTTDHFIPALAVRSTPKGTTLGISYYDLHNANCALYGCALDAAFTSSADGGSTWSKPVHLGGPLKLPWLALTNIGYMVGDYLGSIYPSAYIAPITLAVAPSGGLYDETIDLPGISQGGFGFSHAPPRGFLDLGLADDAAAHARALRPVFQPARLAPQARHDRPGHPL